MGGLHSGRQRLAHCPQRRLDGAGQLDGIGRRLFLDAEDHRGLAFEAGVAALQGRGKGHFGDLPQQDRLAVTSRDSQARQILQTRRPPQVANQVLASIEFKEAAGSVRRIALERLLQLRMADTQLGHARRVGLDLELADLTANRDHLSNTGDRHQARTQHPVGELAHLHRGGLVRIDGDRDLHDLAHYGADRSHARDHARWQAFLHRGEPLRHHLPGPKNLRAPVEGDVNERQPAAGDRAHALHAG